MDYKIARDIVENFSKAARAAHNDSYAYEAGYHQSVLLELLEQVPADVCFKFLHKLETATKQLQKQAQATA